MSVTVTNIYKLSRERTCLTQETAAEKLNISTRQIARYESGERRPDDRTVIRMISLYRDDRLACDYISESEVGRSVLPTFESRNMPSAFLTLQKEINDISRLYDEVIEIICDGNITEAEKPKYENFMRELNELMTAGLAMKYAK